MSANDRQVGGSHYEATVQHWDFVVQALLDHYLSGNATKYLSRWRRKAGLQDLEKALHYVDKLIEQVLAGLVVPPPWAGEQTMVQALELTYQFLQANGIQGTQPEAEIIERLVSWRDVSVLYEARAILVDMIHDEKERLAALPTVRPTKDQWALELALITAKRGTCARRKVGCVLLDARGHVLATGYNGRAAGLDHCSEGHPCAGATAPSGTNLDACEAIHAEQNALMQCADVHQIDTVYTTASPCLTCVKMLINTGARRIVFLEEYPHPAAKELWLNSDVVKPGGRCQREWVRGTL